MSSRGDARGRRSYSPDRDRDLGRRRRDRSRSRSRGRRRRDGYGRHDNYDDPLGGYGDGHYGRGMRDQDTAPRVPRGASQQDLEVIRAQTEIDDLTKDQRTVFVSQLVMKATEKQIRKFFEKIGKVKDVIMIRDKYTNRHKGYAYVELQDLESVPMVLMLNGTVPDFQRFPILVKASEAEKNFLAKQEAAQASAETDAAAREAAMPKRQLLVGNLHPNITEGDLRTVLAPFGAVESVDMASVPKGSAVVTFALADDALKASSKIGGIELGADKPITVEFYQPPSVGASSIAMDSLGAGGIAGVDRTALMGALGARAGVAPPPLQAAPPPPAPPPPLQGPPTPAFVISNMFDPATETDPNWKNDIKEDVTAECAKFGRVAHVHVDGVSPRGLVNVLFDDAAGAAGAAGALHGRWFAGRAITCSYVNPEVHKAQFM